jgi:hypothetical protein
MKIAIKKNNKITINIDNYKISKMKSIKAIIRPTMMLKDWIKFKNIVY